MKNQILSPSFANWKLSDLMPLFASHRSLLRFKGTEAKSYLDRVLTCRTTDIEDGVCRFGALLTPQGKIISDLFVYGVGSELMIDAPSSLVSDVQKRLTLLKLRADVQIEPVSDLQVYVSSERPADSGLVFEDPRPGATLYRVLTSEAFATEDDVAWASLRAENILPETVLDYDTVSTFPADVNMDILGGVDYRKGCFIGQEVASRMKRKSEARKRTLGLSGPKSLQKGDEITSGETKIGDVLSWDGRCGLGLIRLDRLGKALAQGATPEIQNQPVTLHIPDGIVVPDHE